MTPTTQGGTPLFQSFQLKNGGSTSVKKSKPNVYKSFIDIRKTKLNTEASTRKCDNSTRDIDFQARVDLVNKLMKTNDSSLSKGYKQGSLSTKQSEKTFSQSKTKRSFLGSEKKSPHQNKS